MTYPEDFVNKIVCGNCLEELIHIPNNSVDLVCTDPPYGINYTEWDKELVDISNQCKRILKPNGSIIIFAGWSTCLKVKITFEKYFKLNNWIIYDRIKGRGAKYNLVSTREDILWFVNSDQWRFNKQESTTKKKTGGMGNKNGLKNRVLSNVWSDISPLVPWSKEKVAHPTQKPLQLMERIIKVFSNEDDLVLDPFAGSGTTAIACKNLGRNFIGIELSSEYCKIAEERLK